MIKSEHLVSLTITGGIPGFAMCSQGVQQARDGIDDPLTIAPFLSGYDEPIPEANVEFVSGTALRSVFAFPQAVPAPPGPPPPPSGTGRLVHYTKPTWSG